VRRGFFSVCVPTISILPADRSSSLTAESTVALSEIVFLAKV
jgi:hypothetical protein